VLLIQAGEPAIAEAAQACRTPLRQQMADVRFAACPALDCLADDAIPAPDITATAVDRNATPPRWDPESSRWGG